MLAKVLLLENTLYCMKDFYYRYCHKKQTIIQIKEIYSLLTLAR